MFDHRGTGVGLLPGERPEFEAVLQAEDDLAYEVACREHADGWTEPDRHVLPDDLETIPPGLFLAAVVSSVDVGRLNGHDVVRLMQARARLSSHQEAHKYEAMAEIAYAPASDPDSGVLRSSEEMEYAAVEVAAALTLTRRSSQDQLDRAVSLQNRLGRVWETFAEGRIDLMKVRVFDQTLGHLPETTIDTVLDQILDDAPGLTTGQLRARVSKLVLEADPDGAASSFEEGLADRKVIVDSNPDHTANFHVYSGRPQDVTAARSHVETLARDIKANNDDDRGLDEIRTDVALDLLAGKCMCATSNTTSGRTNVTIDGETLIGLSDKPGELDGYGPVIAEIARKTVYENIDGEWTFTVTDNGKPVSTGTLTRRPTESQKRQVAANYPKCTAPGCRMDAWDCDLDHRQPWANDGKTCVHNLAPLCRHHHQTKDEGGWKLQRLENGDHQPVRRTGDQPPRPHLHHHTRPTRLAGGHPPTTRPSTTSTPSSVNSLICRSGSGVLIRPPEPTTLHHGNPSDVLKTPPTARAAPG